MANALTARILTIYPVQKRPGAVAAGSAFIDAAAEAQLFGVTPMAGQSEFVASPWRPAITEPRDWAQEIYQAPHAGIAYQVARVRTAVARMPGGIELVLLDLTVEAEPAGLILAERDAYDPSVEIKLGSVTLAEGALGDTVRLEAAAARQQILLLPGGPTAHFAGGDPAALTDEQAGLLRQLLIKDTEIGYRPAQMAVEVPADINGPDRQAVFVWATNTVAEGLEQYGELGRLRVLALVLSNCQVLAATMVCRRIREAALVDLGEPAPAVAEPAEALRDRAERRVRQVARLRQELSRDAEMHARGTAVLGGRPLFSYHQTVVAESELPLLLSVTQHLLEQLSTALAVEQQLRHVQEARETAEQQLAVIRTTQRLLDQSEALKAASVVFASVAAVLGLAGLFAQTAAIPRAQDGTYFGSVTGSVVFVLTVAALAVIVGVWVRAASKATLPARLRRPAVAVRWSLTAATTAGLAGSAVGLLIPNGSAATSAGLLVAGLGAILLVVLIALEFDFDRSRDGA